MSLGEKQCGSAGEELKDLPPPVQNGIASHLHWGGQGCKSGVPSEILAGAMTSGHHFLHIQETLPFPVTPDIPPLRAISISNDCSFPSRWSGPPCSPTGALLSSPCPFLTFPLMGLQFHGSPFPQHCCLYLNSWAFVLPALPVDKLLLGAKCASSFSELLWPSNSAESHMIGQVVFTNNSQWLMDPQCCPQILLIFCLCCLWHGCFKPAFLAAPHTRLPPAATTSPSWYRKQRPPQGKCLHLPLPNSHTYCCVHHVPQSPTVVGQPPLPHGKAWYSTGVS